MRSTPIVGCIALLFSGEALAALGLLLTYRPAEVAYIFAQAKVLAVGKDQEACTLHNKGSRLRNNVLLVSSYPDDIGEEEIMTSERGNLTHTAL